MYASVALDDGPEAVGLGKVGRAFTGDGARKG
jgi:hypothetical protein